MSPTKERALHCMTEQHRKGIIAFSITDRGALYSAYMSFLEGGGVFVPTTRSYELGDSVFLLLKLMNDPEPLAVKGRVVWITPAGAQGNKSAGVGVQFIEDDTHSVRSGIEHYLAATLQGERPTQTM